MLKKTIVGIMMFLMLVIGLNCLCFAESGGVTAADTVPAHNITLRPILTAKSYSITYNLDGGSVAAANPTSYTVESGEITLHNPTKEGYEFTGWTGSNGYMPSKSVIIQNGKTGNLSFTANWKANTYTITYNGNGSTGGTTEDTTFVYGNTATIRSNGYTKTDETFCGWNTKPDGTGTEYEEGSDYSSAANLVLYAQWGYILEWTSPLADIGLYLGNGNGSIYEDYLQATSISKSNYIAYKRIAYTNTRGETAYANPYEPGSITIKSGSEVKLQMIADHVSSNLSWVIDGNTVGKSNTYNPYELFSSSWTPSCSRSLKKDREWNSSSTMSSTTWAVKTP